MSAELRAAAWLASHGEPIDDLHALGFHMRARAALGKAVNVLSNAGVPALVVKGAVLAYSLYPSPIDRPIRDVDLRIVPAHLGRAVAALEAAGGRVLVSSRVYRNAVLKFHRMEIDVETQIGPPFVCAIPVAKMLERAERTDAGLDFVHLRPELHDHALLLAVNAFKDRLDLVPAWRLRDLELIARAPAFDVEVFARRANEAGCRTLVHIVGRHLGRTLRSETWHRVAVRISPARPMYAERMLQRLEAPPRDAKAALVAWRTLVRASPDGRTRAVAAVAASAARELEVEASGLRARLHSRDGARRS